MGDIKGFLKVKRVKAEYRPVCERVKDFSEVAVLPDQDHSEGQASRCMDCGVPFCHWGCPIANIIPEWNDLVFRKQWEKAYKLLASTNILPEVTGRICPALCEYACVLGINDDPVTIRENELAIIEYAFSNGLVKPNPPQKRTGKKVAVVGSGPSGLACADRLNKAGHSVVVFERDKLPGGILRYGIPDFKLEKNILDRRIKILKREGIDFRVSEQASGARLLKDFDAVALACGSRVPRDLKIEGRDLAGIHFAMDYLIQSNKRISREKISDSDLIDAKGKKAVVIGGGDTGADCVGVAHRQGASCVIQIEIMPKPQEFRPKEQPWPRYPTLLKSSSSHEEGGERYWSVATKCFSAKDGRLSKLICERQGREFEIEADLAILALGFLHPEKQGLVDDLGLELDNRGNVKTDGCFMTSKKGIFSCGDMRRGQSLVVWAIYEGCQCAHGINSYLQSGKST